MKTHEESTCFFIVVVKDADQKEVFDPDKKIVAEMKRIINEIKTAPQKQNYKGCRG